ncbi:MAG: hypothetical protein OXM55_04410 [Bdellovibrionales bacterium]|nr:hypothetical protein [Bdellovibrionales bacterium]
MLPSRPAEAEESSYLENFPLKSPLGKNLVRILHVLFLKNYVIIQKGDDNE